MSRALCSLLDAIRILAQLETQVKYAVIIRKLQHAEAHLLQTFPAPEMVVSSLRFVDSFDHYNQAGAAARWPVPSKEIIQ